MKKRNIKRTGCAALAALLILVNMFPAAADEILPAPENTITESADTDMPEDTTADGSGSDLPDDTAADGSGSDLPGDTTADGSGSDLPDDTAVDSGQPDDEPKPDDREPDVPQVPPAFSAHMEWTGGNGYIVRGTFTEFTTDLAKIQPMYSLDGEVYQLCPDIICWDLSLLGTEDPGELKKLQNQVCLVSNMEPLKSYLAGTLDRFYLKLCITKENGASYETQAAVIDRGSPQPLPEGITASAMFGPSLLVIERRPLRIYGKYQLTVSEDMSSAEIAAYLPDTVPVRVGLQSGRNALADCTVDCPVIWKPFTLPSLSPGESVTIRDAAEAIFVPAGTLAETPIGVFRLEEALSVDDAKTGQSDDIDLVLNVVPEDAAPTGALSEEWGGLELSFDLKPAGATSIQAYTCVDGDTQWTKLPGLLSLNALNGQLSTANSDYALVIDNDTEPYRSYLLQKESGNPAPFYIGIKIEGGVYDGKELILAWPDSYDLPLSLPKLGGSGGNENNAGSDGKGDSTGEGQRPTLPENPSGSSESQSPGADSGAQGKPESPDTTEPGQSDPQQPDASEPEQSDPQPPDRPKPERPSDRQPDEDMPQDGAENKSPDAKPENAGPVKGTGTGTGKNSVSNVNASTEKNSLTGDKTRASGNSATDRQTSAAKNPAADGDTPTEETPAVKKTWESDTPASPDLLSDDALHTNGEEDLLTAQASQTNDILPVRPDRAKAPERNETSDSRPLFSLACAAALFGICIARAKKSSKK